MTWALVVWCIVIATLAVAEEIHYGNAKRCAHECKRFLGSLGETTVVGTVGAGIIGAVILGGLWLIVALASKEVDRSKGEGGREV